MNSILFHLYANGRIGKIAIALIAFALGYWALSHFWLEPRAQTAIFQKAEDDFLRTMGEYVRRDYPDAEYRFRRAAEAYLAANPDNARFLEKQKSFETAAVAQYGFCRNNPCAGRSPPPLSSLPPASTPPATFLEEFGTTALGTLIDPFVLLPAILIGWAPYRWLRGALAGVLGMVVTMIIIGNRSSETATISFLAGSLARGGIAWGVASLVRRVNEQVMDGKRLPLAKFGLAHRRPRPRRNYHPSVRQTCSAP